MVFEKTNYNTKYIKIKDLKTKVNIEDLHVNIEDLHLNDKLFFGLFSVIVTIGASLKLSTSIKFSDSSLHFKKATKTSTSVTLSLVLATLQFII